MGTMLKWFAPLLVFATKPELMLRALTLAVAGGILAFGVWLLSNVALTFDSLKSPYVAAVYAIVLACFFIGVGAVTWLRVRRLAAPGRPSPAIRAAEAPPLPNDVVNSRAQAISKKWFGDSRSMAANTETTLVPAAAPPSERPAGTIRGSLTVTGPAFSGKTALIATLAGETSKHADERDDIVRLVEAGPVDGDAAELSALVAGAATTNGILFVIDQDLRGPEVAAIARFVASGKPLYVVLNKADQFSAAERDAILLSIRAKMPVKFPPGRVISVAAAPNPVEREIEDARGTVRVELRRPPSDVRALINLLGREFPAAPGQALKFVAA